MEFTSVDVLNKCPLAPIPNLGQNQQHIQQPQSPGVQPPASPGAASSGAPPDGGIHTVPPGAPPSGQLTQAGPPGAPPIVSTTIPF